MFKILSFIKKQDYFGYEVNLHYGSEFSDEKEGEKEFKTLLGGLLSIGLRVVYIFCCVMFLIKMVTNQEGRIE